MFWLTGIAGLFLMVAPYAFGYSHVQSALWTSILAGLVVVASSLWEGLESKKENWEYWTAGIVGVLAIIAPFVLGFGSETTAMWTTVITGAVIAFLALSRIWMGGPSHS